MSQTATDIANISFGYPHGTVNITLEFEQPAADPLEQLSLQGALNATYECREAQLYVQLDVLAHEGTVIEDKQSIDLLPYRITVGANAAVVRVRFDMEDLLLDTQLARAIIGKYVYADITDYLFGAEYQRLRMQTISEMQHGRAGSLFGGDIAIVELVIDEDNSGQPSPFGPVQPLNLGEVIARALRRRAASR